ncbi:MAG TPA: YihY/virulence factor BrkB family protein [Bryobacteraceae bacterium]|nr:YihY/virulence factor BrkB family protein [Bryobacteraceae bacterium]
METEMPDSRLTTPQLWVVSETTEGPLLFHSFKKQQLTDNGSETPRETVRRVGFFFSLHGDEIRRIVKSTLSAWSDDKVPRLAASLAYYTALSLAPLIVVLLGIAGLAFGRAAAQSQLLWQIRQTAGDPAVRAVQGLLGAAHKPTTGLLATAIGLVTACFGATSAVVELTDALNTIWHVPGATGSTGMRSILAYLKQRTLSLLLVSGVGLFLLLSLFVNTWLAAVGKYFAGLLPSSELLLEIANFILSFVVITVLFAVIFRMLPSVRLKWSDVAIGAAVTSLLFTVGKLLIALYLGKSTVGSAYGAAGSFVILLVWIYYSALVFFLGAEFTRVYTREVGSHSDAQPCPPEPPPRPDVVLVDSAGKPVDTSG